MAAAQSDLIRRVTAGAGAFESEIAEVNPGLVGLATAALAFAPEGSVGEAFGDPFAGFGEVFTGLCGDALKTIVERHQGIIREYFYLFWFGAARSGGGKVDPGDDVEEYEEGFHWTLVLLWSNFIPNAS